MGGGCFFYLFRCFLARTFPMLVCQSVSFIFFKCLSIFCLSIFCIFLVTEFSVLIVSSLFLTFSRSISFYEFPMSKHSLRLITVLLNIDNITQSSVMLFSLNSMSSLLGCFSKMPLSCIIMFFCVLVFYENVADVVSCVTTEFTCQVQYFPSLFLMFRLCFFSPKQFCNLRFFRCF